MTPALAAAARNISSAAAEMHDNLRQEQGEA